MSTENNNNIYSMMVFDLKQFIYSYLLGIYGISCKRYGFSSWQKKLSLKRTLSWINGLEGNSCPRRITKYGHLIFVSMRKIQVLRQHFYYFSFVVIVNNFSILLETIIINNKSNTFHLTINHIGKLPRRKGVICVKRFLKSVKQQYNFTGSIYLLL